jgi:hypothetical protein
MERFEKNTIILHFITFMVTLISTMFSISMISIQFSSNHTVKLCDSKMKNNEQYIRTEIVRPDFGEWGINLATRNKNWGSEQIFFLIFLKSMKMPTLLPLLIKCLYKSLITGRENLCNNKNAF